MGIRQIVMVVGFIGVTFVLIQIVNLIFRRLERKNNAAHLRFYHCDDDLCACAAV